MKFCLQPCILYEKLSLNPKTKSLFELNFATFLLGCNGLFAKLIALPAALIILGRSVFAVLTLIIFLLFTKTSLKLKTFRHYFYMLVFGIFLALHWVTFFYSIQVSNVAVGMIALFTFPLMTAFLEPLFSKVKLKLFDLIGALFVFIGVLFIVPEFDLNNSVFQGVLWGIVSALLYALRNVFTKHYLKDYPSSLVMFYQVLVTAIVLSPLVFFHEFTVNIKDFYYLILVGVLFTAVAHTLFVKSLNDFSAKSVSIITSLQPLYAIVLAFIFLDEMPSGRTLVGGLIILSVVIFETYNSRQKEALNA